MTTPLSTNELLLGKDPPEPAIVVLLPVGFAAGIITTDVQLSYLVGPLYQPWVPVAAGGPGVADG